MRKIDGRTGARRGSGTRTERPSAEDATFNLETFLPHQLAASAARVSRLFGRHYADHHELSLPEWQVIAIVGRHAGISPTGAAIGVGQSQGQPCGQGDGQHRPPSPPDGGADDVLSHGNLGLQTFRVARAVPWMKLWV